MFTIRNPSELEMRNDVVAIGVSYEAFVDDIQVPAFSRLPLLFLMWWTSFLPHVGVSSTYLVQESGPKYFIFPAPF